MSQQVRITEPLGTRAATLPLDLGGAGAALALPGVEGIAVTLQASGLQWLAHPAAGARARLNGMPLLAPQPVADGDVIGVGDAQVTVRPGAASIEVHHLAGNDTVAPLLRDELPGDVVVAGVSEVLAARGPAGDAGAGRSARLTRWTLVGAAAGLLLLLAGLLLALVPVPLQVQPAQARAGSPGLLDWHRGGRIFLLPGRREVTISHPGYRSQSVTLQVSRALVDARPLQVALEYLPGVVEIDTGGIEAEVLVDGQRAGSAPGEIQMPAGTRDVILRSPRHIDRVERIEVAGGGQHQGLRVALQPSVGYLALDTAPAGATISVDGTEQGAAPQRLELAAGLHQLVLSAPGRRSWSSEVAIIAGQTLDLGRIDLAQPPAVALRAAEERQVETAAAAQASAPGVDAAPAPAPAPAAPRPPPPSRVQSALLGTLVLLPAGEYVQGSERREQGRRSNEAQRTVKLTRAFYLAATEVSNAQFKTFRPAHVAGVVAGKSLDLDPQAVSNVTWNDAVEFCNWLSLREGLPAAYERRAGRWQLVQPLNHGYRLPTEAEWEYAARYVDGTRWQRYAWGDDLPPPAGAANLAGAEALAPKPGADAAAPSSVPQYKDEHDVIAPVDAYARAPAGLRGMGGNVSEWVHDVYESMPAAVTVTDPMGPATDGAHVVRGANWRSATIAELRLAWRDSAAAPSVVTGFRVARFAEEPP